MSLSHSFHHTYHTTRRLVICLYIIFDSLSNHIRTGSFLSTRRPEGGGGDNAPYIFSDVGRISDLFLVIKELIKKGWFAKSQAIGSKTDGEGPTSFGHAMYMNILKKIFWRNFTCRQKLYVRNNAQWIPCSQNCYSCIISFSSLCSWLYLYITLPY